MVSARGPHNGLTANYAAEDFESDKQNFERQLEASEADASSGCAVHGGDRYRGDPYIFPRDGVPPDWRPSTSFYFRIRLRCLVGRNGHVAVDFEELVEALRGLQTSATQVLEAGQAR